MPLTRNRVFVTLAVTVAAAAITGFSGTAAAHIAIRPAQQAAQPLRVATPSPLPSIGQAQPEKHPDVQATINSLHRDSNGLVTLTWTVKNNGTESFHPSTEFLSDYAYQGQSSNGITLTDEAGKIRYNPLRMQQSNSCVCNSLSAGPLILDQGDSMYMFESYKLAPEVTTVTINIPGFSSLKNIQVN